MKTPGIFLAFLLMCAFVVSCEKKDLATDQEIKDLESEFTIPEIPEEIASFMTEEDMALFNQGPGEAFLSEPALKSSNKWRSKWQGRWHPVLMKLGYDLQFYPVSSCEPGQGIPCFNLDGTPTGACPEGPGGITGIAIAEGEWFCRSVYSEYVPVFCLPDHDGYGEGFYELECGTLQMEAENLPFQFDEEGNSWFRRNGRYIGDQSTGCFEGARGWEIAIIYTAAENNPAISPTGQGYGTAIIFGWVFY